jgi:hypothetical protein
MSAGQQRNFVFDAVYFCHSASILLPVDTGLTLNLATRDEKERQENITYRPIRKYQDSEQEVSVCALVEHLVIRLKEKSLFSVTST